MILTEHTFYFTYNNVANIYSLLVSCWYLQAARKTYWVASGLRYSHLFESGISIKLLLSLPQVYWLGNPCLPSLVHCSLLLDPFVCWVYVLLPWTKVCFKQRISWHWESPVAVYLNQALPSFQYFNSDSTVVFISLKESPTFDLAKLQAPFRAQERPLAPLASTALVCWEWLQFKPYLND